jgi:indolepyruvate ferredoxin oxidoreductase alpha subunit
VQSGELKVIVFRHQCQLIQARELAEERPRVFIDQELCVGDGCGCVRLCSRVFACPALIWDLEAGAAMIDEVVCARCGLCVNVCPQNAIKVEEI